MGNVWVTGGTGQIGRSLKAIVGEAINYRFTDSKTVDLTNHRAVEQFVIDQNIDAIINCAAFTAVDDAESQKEQAMAINYKAVEHLACLVKKHKLKFIHISTDYVFDGQQAEPYKETENTNPINVYGDSKCKGEQAILALAPANTVIFRTSWVYSPFGKNFVKTMLRLAKTHTEINVVNDQFGGPTSGRSIAEALLQVLANCDSSHPEILHYTNKGQCSWFEFAQQLFKLAQLKVQVNAVDSSQFQTKAKRPQYSVLDCTKIEKKYQLTLRPWQTELQEQLQFMA